MAENRATTLDWWAFRSRSSVPETRSAIEQAWARARGLKGGLTFVPRGGGWQGYESSDVICFGEMPVGLLAYGGAQQRGWCYASFTGKGLHWMGDYDQAADFLQHLTGYSLRRVDIALTTKDGSLTHDRVLAAHRSGGFSLGGRPPSLRQILPDDPRDGRTIYIGSRERDKFVRAYEKGWEMLGAMPIGLRDSCTIIDGVSPEKIYRIELELKPKTCDLPRDLIGQRDQYFAGAYPYLQEVLGIEPELLQIKPEKLPQIDLASALANLRYQWGSTLFTALTAHHGDLTTLWPKICGEHHNQRLVEAGVLLVDHE